MIASRALVRHRPERYVVQATKLRIVGWATYRIQGLRIRMSVLSEIRRLPEVIQNLTNAVMRVVAKLDLLIDLQAENGSSDDRLEELERTRAHWEAQMEALVLKADSTLKSASNAESRSRTMVRHAEKLVDPFSDEGEEVPETAPGGDDPRVEAEEVLPVPVDLATNNKAEAMRAKWLT